MNKLLLLIAVSATMLFSGCSQFDTTGIWNAIEDLQDAQQELEDEQEKMQNQIDAQQTLLNALANGLTIISIAPTEEGFLLTFSDGSTITVKHGEKGDKGDTGEQGAQGEKGDKGDTGEQGAQGEKGDKGDTGEQGAQGEKGDKGDNGEDGADGKDGENGKDGADGKDGQDGADGKDGADGDSFFQSVTWDDENVYFTLVDGTVITIPIGQTSVHETIKVIITPAEDLITSDKIVFNIKTADLNNQLMDAVYAVNTRDAFLRDGYTLEDIMTMNSAYATYHFSGAMLNQTNSANGYNFEIAAAPGEELGIAIMGTPSKGKMFITEVVYATAKDLEAPERVEHEYFESLKGSWTATTIVLTNGGLIQRSCEVTVGDVEYPETLSQEIYDIYAQYGHSTEVVDAHFEQFKDAADKFNEKTRAFNRILMNGFNFEDSSKPYFNYSSAFELFYSTTYSGDSAAAMIKDFGPKWYLEIAADGTVTAPFNSAYFDPMSSWYHDTQSYYESYLMGYHIDSNSMGNNVLAGYFSGRDGGYQNGHFPVEVSEDGNTITVKPLIYTYQYEGETVSLTFYPTSCLDFGSGSYDPLEICSDIILTRNAE